MVKDVALHLLDDGLGWLLDDTGEYQQFVAALDATNQQWVDDASG